MSLKWKNADGWGRPWSALPAAGIRSRGFSDRVFRTVLALPPRSGETKLFVPLSTHTSAGLKLPSLSTTMSTTLSQTHRESPMERIHPPAAEAAGRQTWAGSSERTLLVFSTKTRSEAELSPTNTVRQGHLCELPLTL